MLRGFSSLSLLASAAGYCERLSEKLLTLSDISHDRLSFEN